jgi:hypothetical protein
MQLLKKQDNASGRGGTTFEDLMFRAELEVENTACRRNGKFTS